MSYKDRGVFQRRTVTGSLVGKGSVSGLKVVKTKYNTREPEFILVR